MGAGMPGVEFEAHGRIASTVRKWEGDRAKKRQNPLKNVKYLPVLPDSISESDRLLGRVLR